MCANDSWLFPNSLFKMRCTLTLSDTAWEQEYKWVRFCLSVLNVVWVISPQDTNVPTFREVLCLINEPVRALFHHTASSAERSCPLRSLQPHNASFFFLGSAHGFLLLGCPWQRIIIWIACQSLSSTRCHPHSSALSFQLPLTLSSWPCSCFWGIFPLFPHLNIVPVWRGYVTLISHSPFASS